MRYLVVKNYDKYQNHKAKDPEWVKLYRKILTDQAFLQLPVECRYLFLCCLILASETFNRCCSDVSYLSQRCFMTVSPQHINALISSGLIEASRTTKWRSEKRQRRDREETEIDPAGVCVDDFNLFWQAYPKKVGKEAARKAWQKATGKPALADILRTVELSKQTEQWKKERGQFIPNPATWLNQGRWSDEPTNMESAFMRGMNSFLDRHKEEDV